MHPFWLIKFINKRGYRCDSPEWFQTVFVLSIAMLAGVQTTAIPAEIFFFLPDRCVCSNLDSIVIIFPVLLFFNLCVPIAGVGSKIK